MRPRVLALAAAAVLAILMIQVSTRPATVPPQPKPPAPVAAPSPAVQPSAAPTANAVIPPPLPQPPPAARASTRRVLADPLVPSDVPGVSAAPSPAVDPDIAADLDRITLMLRDYRTLAGENPVGTNAEIMKAIMGGNPKGAMLGPPEGQTLNERDELIDRWGTPYFFHQLSKDLMEIRSAGPDRIMGTGDDAVSR